MTEKITNPEKVSSKEVFTDDVALIDQNDPETTVRAFTVSCGVLTLDHRISNTVGIIHLSEGGAADEIVNYAETLGKKLGVNLSEFTMRRFNGSKTIWSSAEKALNEKGLQLPPWETAIEPGIEINKNTGEISFYV